jgi:serine/threonine protein kinase
MNPERWQRIESIYNRVLEIEPGQRAAFIEGACAGDDSMRREVERLLARQPEAEHFIESPAIEMVAQALARDQLPHAGKDPAGPVWLQSGSTLLHYRIEEKIGEGGMGEIYRAEDTNLSRQVAIKALPDEFAHDAERLARFEREAKLLASLNHPNIAAIYGLEQADGKPFLVLELVEGQTLAERLQRGRIPPDETLDICRQVAEGLEAAHEKGIIHRDLKPANVKVTPEGKVKVLDFGLAKAFYEEATSVGYSRSPIITDQMTAPGVILGTYAYMSPEQARGKTVDKRADIWAFGCVLYECLTAKRAFQGYTITERVAAILNSEPDWALLPANTPAIARSLLRRCLQKDPNLRLRDIGDLRIEMGEPISQPLDAVAPPRRLLSRWLLAMAVAGPIAGILIGAGLMSYFRPTPSPPVTRAIIRIEPGQWLAGMGRQPEFWRPSRTAMAISRDGRFIVYSAIEGNPSPESVPRLHIRRTDQMEAKPIAGTEGGIHPFLSPDDRWVGFWAGGNLMKVSVEGGVPATLCDVQALRFYGPFGASWGLDNNIVFSPDVWGGLFSVSADSGKPEPLTAPDETNEEYGHRLPHFLPNGKGLLFTITREPWDTQCRVAVLDLKTRKWRVLLEDAADARYVPTGHLVFLRRGTLMAVAFDLNRLDITGQPVPAIANVMQAICSTHAVYNTCAGQFDISDSGWLTYVTGGIVPDMENSLVWVDQRGNSQPVASFKAPFTSPRLSPDGQRIAYSTRGSESRLQVYDLARGSESPLTGEGNSLFPSWTTDMKRLVFSWWKSGHLNLYRQAADGSSSMERLTASECDQYLGSLRSDGVTLAFVEIHPDTGCDIFLLDMQNRRVTPFLNSRSIERYPVFSPDGRWLAYSSDESGREEVYVRPFPNPDGKWKLSLEGGTEPLWARNGKQLFYRRHDQAWEVDVRTDTGFIPGTPHLLFEQAGYRMSDPIRSWDISPDGQRFLMVKLEERKPQPVTEMILVQNWLEELKRLCPTK